MHRKTPATNQKVALFGDMGQALISTQVLEECLSMAITLKMDVQYPGRVELDTADQMLEKRKRLTLGQAKNIAIEKGLFSNDLLQRLIETVQERNWLIHNIVEDFYNKDMAVTLSKRLRALANKAHSIQCEIEDDLIEFSRSHGIKVRENLPHSIK